MQGETSGKEFLFFFYIINNRSLSLLFPSSVAPGRPARRQKRSEDDWNAASSPYHHLPLRPSKSLNYSRNRSNSSDSITDLAESLVATTDDAVFESSPTSPYSDHLRSSSYALLRPPGQPQQQPVPATPPSGPQSMLLPSVIASRFSTSGMAYGGGGGLQSMPYVSSSMLIEGNPQNRMLPKTPRTCELEEYARRYEAMQRGNASRRRVSQAHADPSAAPTNGYGLLICRISRISFPLPPFSFPFSASPRAA